MTLPVQSFDIGPGDSSHSVSLTIVDDTIAEDTESLMVSLRVTVTSTPISQDADTEITIEDNEGI